MEVEDQQDGLRVVGGAVNQYVAEHGQCDHHAAAKDCRTRIHGREQRTAKSNEQLRAVALEAEDGTQD